MDLSLQATRSDHDSIWKSPEDSQHCGSWLRIFHRHLIPWQFNPAEAQLYRQVQPPNGVRKIAKLHLNRVMLNWMEILGQYMQRVCISKLLNTTCSKTFGCIKTSVDSATAKVWLCCSGSPGVCLCVFVCVCASVCVCVCVCVRKWPGF